jgi:ferredoxin
VQVAWVEINRCTGCGACVDTCPSRALSMRDGKAWVEEHICTGCGDCVPICPEGAIQLLLQGELVPDRHRVELASPRLSPVPAAIVVTGAGLLVRVIELALQVLERRLERRCEGGNISRDASPYPDQRPGRGRRRRQRRRGG